MRKSKALESLAGWKSNKNIMGGRRLNQPPNADVTRYYEPIGIEVEIEGINLPVEGIPDRWKVVRDGSLRGGLEYILREPCGEMEYKPYIRALFDSLCEAEIKLSNRCSTHVHINCSGMRANEQTSFVALWTVFEKPLIRWCGDSRVGNLFCLSNDDTNGFNTNQWYNALKSGVFDFSNHYKYSALNLGSYNKLGTFEIRCMRGVDSPEPLLPWVAILLQLKKEAMTTYRNPVLLGRDLSELGAKNLFRDICDRAGIGEFGEEVISLSGEGEFESDCLDAFRECQASVYALDWGALEEEIYRQYVEDPFAQAQRPPRPRQMIAIDELDDILEEIDR
jgi:hypothetical protein